MSQSLIRRLPQAEDTVAITSTLVKVEAVSSSRGSVMGSPTASEGMTRMTARVGYGGNSQQRWR